MTIDEGRKKIIESIEPVYGQHEAKNIAELLIEHITNLPLIERILKKNERLSSRQIELLNETIVRLQNHEPVQYIVKGSWFGGMRFYVDKNVLIPRPETEELVEWIITDWKVMAQISNLKSQTPNAKFIDVGTGSGCIAIALKTKLPGIEMWACDISNEALNVARMNADALHAAIDFVPLDFLDPEQRKQLPHVDVIVSNPPYVPEEERNGMGKNVTWHEPAVALFVPDNDPLVFYNAIADFGKENLNEDGSIYVEINENLGERVKNLFLGKGYLSVELKKDLQGKDRMIRARSR